MEVNEEMRGFIQQWFVEPQLLDSDDTKTEENQLRNEGIKRVIQKMFIKYQVLGFDSIKPLLENAEGAQDLYEALSNKDGEEFAKEIFVSAIKEAQESVAAEYGMGPRRKKEHEILAEKLDEKYGIGSIESNINRMIFKTRGGNDTVDCSDSGCGC